MMTSILVALLLPLSLYLLVWCVNYAIDLYYEEDKTDEGSEDRSPSADLGSKKGTCPLTCNCTWHVAERIDTDK